MKYIEFYHAAKRHLETCRQLKEDIENCKGNEQELLQNLYYLGGYVVECVYKYAIYKEINFPINYDVKQLHLGTGGWSQTHLNYKISFENKKTKQYDISICSTCGKETKIEVVSGDEKKLFVIIQISKHSISQGMDFFSNADFAQKNWEIPILGTGNIGTCQNLVEKWCADVRYEITFPLDKTEVFSFFELIKTIFEGIENEYPPV